MSNVRVYFSEYHDGVELGTTWLEVLTLVSWVLFAGAIVDETSPFKPSVLFFCINVFLSIFSALGLYQSWFCKRVKHGQLIKSNIWINPVPAYFFLWMCVSPLVFILLFRLFLGGSKLFTNSGVGFALITLWTAQFFIWLFWVQITRNKTRDFIWEQRKDTHRES